MLFLLVITNIGNHPGRPGRTQRIDHGEDIDDLLGNRTRNRREVPERGENHPHDAEDHAPDRDIVFSVTDDLFENGKLAR